MYTSSTFDTIAFLHKENEQLPILQADDSDLNSNNLDFLIAENLEPAVYYVAVASVGYATGTYTLHSEKSPDVGRSILGVKDDTNALLTLGTPKNGIIVAGDQDTYKLVLNNDADVVFYTETETKTKTDGLDTTGALFDDVGGRIEQSDDSELSLGASDFFIGQTLEAGTYYIAVLGYGGGTGPYKLHVEGVPVSSGRGSAIGVLSDDDTGDTFSFSGTSGKDVFVYSLGPTDTVGAMGGETNDDGRLSPAGGAFFLGDGLSSGTVTVTGFDGDTGPYRVVVETGDDQGDTTATAPAITASPTLGLIAGGSDQDWFKLDLLSATEVFLFTTGYTDTKATLYESDGNTEVSSDDDTGVSFNCLIKEPLAAGTYYLEIEGFDSSETVPYALFAETVFSLPLDAAASDSPVGLIGPHHAQDIFKLDLSGETSKKDIWIYTVRFVDSYGTLYDSDLNEIASNDESELFGRSTNFQLIESLDPGVYYIAVSSFNTNLGLYFLQAETVTESSRMDLGETKPGTIDSETDSDRVTVNLGGKSNVYPFRQGHHRPAARAGSLGRCERVQIGGGRVPDQGRFLGQRDGHGICGGLRYLHHSGLG